VPAPENRCRTAEEQRAHDDPTEWVDEQDHRDEQHDQQPDGAPVSRRVGVDVLTRVGLAPAAARDGDGQNHREK
jgi:hypothetical protein